MKQLSILAASLMCSVILSAQTREAAVLFSGSGMDYSYLLAEKVSVVFDEEGSACICLDEKDEKGFVLDEDYPVTAEFKDAFKLKANQYPKNTSNYYSTFFTSDGAYKVPSEAKAYTGEVKTNKETDVLKLTDVGNIIHKSEAVILRASQSAIILMPSCDKTAASTDNNLSGTDVATTLGANQYALSLGQNGVGFYLWEGEKIGANKAYLTLNGTKAKAFTFMFADGTTTGIQEASPKSSPEGKDCYDLNGMRINGNGYKGIVIKNRKKVYQK